jgi:hypothetical protein
MYKLEPIPTIEIPSKQYIIPKEYESDIGKILTPTWIADAITTMFERVPNPGFSRRGIHRSRTSALIAKVDQPIVMSRRLEIPCVSTDHGAFPMSL